MNGDPYQAWLEALGALTADAVELARWQERRYRFAHRLGALLTETSTGSSAVAGPVLYGVFTSGAGICYVGQTQEAERRLRDLPVGESHHLANTLPPELWAKVVVLRWPTLLAKAPRAERAIAADLGHSLCGLALEHALQVATAPPLNSRRRQPNGDWRPRSLAQSRSRGAVHSRSLPQLSELVLQTWEFLSTAVVPSHQAVSDWDVGRVVLPPAVAVSVQGTVAHSVPVVRPE